MKSHQFNIKYFICCSMVILLSSCSRSNMRLGMMNNSTEATPVLKDIDNPTLVLENNTSEMPNINTLNKAVDNSNNNNNSNSNNNNINTAKSLTEESDIVKVTVNLSPIDKDKGISSAGNTPYVHDNKLKLPDEFIPSENLKLNANDISAKYSNTRNTDVSMDVNVDVNEIKMDDEDSNTKNSNSNVVVGHDLDNIKSFNLLTKAIKDKVDDNTIMYIAKNTDFINHKDKFGKYPIDYAARTSSIYKKLKHLATESSIDEKIIRYIKEDNLTKLSKLGASNEEYLLLRDKNDNTLLHIACKNTKHNIVLFLLNKYPMLINALNKSKETPLECAIKAQKGTIAKLLLENGGYVQSKFKIRTDKFKNLHKKFTPEAGYQLNADSDDSFGPPIFDLPATNNDDNNAKFRRYSTKEQYKENFKKISSKFNDIAEANERYEDENKRYEEQLEHISMELAISKLKENMNNYDESINIDAINNDKYFGETALQKLCTLKGHSKKIKDFAFSSNIEYLISASEDDTLKLWRLNKKPHLVQTYTSNNINCVDFVGFNCSSFLSLDDKNLIKIWNVSDKNPMMEVKLTEKWNANKICYSPNKELLVGYGDSKNIIFIDLLSQNKNKMETNCNKVSILCFSPDSKFMAISDANNKVDIWDVMKKKCIYSIEKTMTCIEDICYSTNGQLLVGGYQNFQIWDIFNNRLIYDINIEDASKSKKRNTLINMPNISIFKTNPTKIAINNNTIAASTKDGCISFFRIFDAQFIQKHPTETYSYIDNLKFGGNSCIAASGTSESKNKNIIKVWVQKD